MVEWRIFECPAQDKLFMKRVISSRGLPTPAWIVSGPGVSARNIVENLGLPVVVKPVVGAESAGVVRCDSEESLKSVIEQPGLLVEKWCRYREFTVGCLVTVQGELLRLWRSCFLARMPC